MKYSRSYNHQPRYTAKTYSKIYSQRRPAAAWTPSIATQISCLHIDRELHFPGFPVNATIADKLKQARPLLFSLTNVTSIFTNMSMKTKIKAFFGPSRQYAVVGASNNPSKFGFKISLWYVTHGLNVIPINPKEEDILGQPVVRSIVDVIKHIDSKKDLGLYKLSGVDGLSISFLTPPHITTQTLNDIARAPHADKIIKALWLQPGSYDQEVLDTAKALGFFDKVIHEDECILVRGEEGMYSANL